MQDMDGMRSGPTGHPRLLRCEVRNAQGGHGVRYIELEQFRLWEYMMQHRHGIVVHRVQLGLWVPTAEFRVNPGPYLHAGTVEEVSRLTVSCFNEWHHYTLDIDRFVPTEQLDEVKEIVFGHVNGSGSVSPHCAVREFPGVCVSRRIEDPALELVLGLADMELQTA